MDIANWLAFQMSPRQVKGYLYRTDGGQEVFVSSITEDMLNENELPILISKMDRLFDKGSLSRPPEYETIITKHFQCFPHFLISWAFSFYLRGFSYGLTFREQASSAIYKAHWLRSPVLRHLAQSGGDIKTHPKVNLFPWGTILRAVFHPENPLTIRKVENVQTVLLAVREKSKNLPLQLSASMDTSTRKESKPSDMEIQILDILHESKVFTLYNEKSSTRKLVQWLRRVIRLDVDLGGLLPEVVKIPLSLIKPLIQTSIIIGESTKFRGWEMGYRLKFRRDSIWDQFEDPGIREALSPNYSRRGVKGMVSLD